MKKLNIDRQQGMYLIISPNKESYIIKEIVCEDDADFQKEELLVERMQKKFPYYRIYFNRSHNQTERDTYKKMYLDTVDLLKINGEMKEVNLYDELKERLKAENNNKAFGN